MIVMTKGGNILEAQAVYMEEPVKLPDGGYQIRVKGASKDIDAPLADIQVVQGAGEDECRKKAQAYMDKLYRALGGLPMPEPEK